jgi:hypothetical protein
MVAAGICPVKDKNRIEKIIYDLDRVEFPGNCSPLEVDYSLVVHIKKICPEYIYAIGVSISLPGVSGPCGGVLGNPHMEISSVSKYSISEKIRNGISVAAFPGGPGIMIHGGPDHAEDALRQTEHEKSGVEKLEKIICRTALSGINIAVALTDGTGKGQRGCCMTLENGRTRISEI